FAKLESKLKPLIAEAVVRSVTEEEWGKLSKTIFDEMQGRSVE
ncbi:GntR family transcriptional regulator, partial [Listeria seeligeri FSL S4-171]